MSCHPKAVVTWLTLLLPLVLAWSKPAKAEVVDAPLLSMKRVSFAAGLNHRWDERPQWVTGLYGAYNLTPHLSITGSVGYLHSDTRIEPQVGIRIRLWQGSK